jgi:hypothetical protein
MATVAVEPPVTADVNSGTSLPARLLLNVSTNWPPLFEAAVALGALTVTLPANSGIVSRAA